MPAAGTRTSSSRIVVSGSLRWPPAAAARGRRGRGRGGGGCGGCRPPRRRPGPAWSCWLVAAGSAGRSCCWSWSWLLGPGPRWSCPGSVLLARPAAGPAPSLWLGRGLLGWPDRLRSSVLAGLSPRSRRGPRRPGLGGGVARRSARPAAPARSAVAARLGRPRGRRLAAGLAAGLATGLGRLDGVDQLGLLHGAGAADAEAAGHRLQVGQQHGVESTRFFLGAARRRRSERPGWIRWFPSREVLPTYQCRPADRRRPLGCCFLGHGVPGCARMHTAARWRGRGARDVGQLLEGTASRPDASSR